MKDKKNPKYNFECDECGCRWVADNDEYTVFDHRCPECNSDLIYEHGEVEEIK